MRTKTLVLDAMGELSIELPVSGKCRRKNFGRPYPLTPNLKRNTWHAIAYDVSEWSLKLRKRFGLVEFVHGFLISGDVGVRKPDRAIFEHLLKKTGAAADDIIFVDDNVTNLDAAAMLGIKTILFTSEPQHDGTRHSAVNNCNDLVNVVVAADNREGG